MFRWNAQEVADEPQSVLSGGLAQTTRLSCVCSSAELRLSSCFEGWYQFGMVSRVQSREAIFGAKVFQSLLRLGDILSSLGLASKHIRSSSEPHYCQYFPSTMGLLRMSFLPQMGLCLRAERRFKKEKKAVSKFHVDGVWWNLEEVCS